MKQLYSYQIKLKRIIDGDSIVVDIDVGFYLTVNDRHVRLIGIDTPEIRTLDLEEKARGYKAKDYVEKMFADAISNQARIVLVSHGVDSFGRVLGEVFFEYTNKSICLNEVLLESNHAEVYEK